MQRIYKALFPTLVMLLMTLPVSANDCGGAHVVTTNTPSGFFTFDGTCDFENDMPSQRIGVPQNCLGEIWFQWSPGSMNTTVYNMDFQLTPAGGNCVVNIFLLYSESVDATNPCFWNTSFLFGTSWGYTGYQSVSSANLTNGTPYSFTFNGLDGSGTYFIVVEKVGGAGNQISLAPMVSSTNPSATNDRCSNPQILTVGNGIDPSVLTGPAAGSWINGANISTANGTKQRLEYFCGGGGGATPSTEDHYTNSVIGQCITNGNVGDFFSVPTPGANCKPSIQNTTWYEFTAPVNANDYFINFGSYVQCSQQPNEIYAMVYGPTFSCDASAAIGSLIDCQQVTVQGSIPGQDYSFQNLSLIAGQTYTIAVDGVRNSQCNLVIMISRGNINPILPVTLSYFDGQQINGQNVLNWETSSEEQHDRFDIERSINGRQFESIGHVKGQGNSTTPTTYQYTDTRSPIGSSRYRLRMIDMNGNATYSETVELTRLVESLAVLGIVPNPANDFAEIVLSSPQSISATIAVRDLQGKLLYQERVTRESGEHRIPLNLADYASGLYLIRVSSPDYSYTGKLLVR